MKKVINVLGYIMVFLTILVIVLTWLNNYTFTYKYQMYFRSVNVLQWCVAITMIFLGLNFVNLKKNTRENVYAALCGLFAIGTIIFMYMGVW